MPDDETRLDGVDMVEDETRLLSVVKFLKLMLVQMGKNDAEKAMGQRDLHSTTPLQQWSVRVH